MPPDTDRSWPFFEPRHRALAEQLRDWRPVETDAAGALRRLGEAGLLAWAIPQSLAPGRVDCRALFLLRERLAAADPAADRLLLGQARAAAALLLCGTPEQRARLDAVRAGDWVLGLAEPGPTMLAVATESGFLLTGEALLSASAAADAYVVLAGEADGGSRRKLAFLVPGDTSGLFLGAGGRLRFEGCGLGRDAVIGRIGDGLQITAEIGELFGASSAAAMLGLVRGVLQQAADAGGDRAAFGRRLVEYQAGQAALAELALGFEAAALLTFRCAWARDVEAARMPRETSMARLAAFDCAVAAMAAAKQLPDAADRMPALTAQWREISAGFDRDLSLLLVAGQVLNQLQPAADGWYGVRPAIARARP